MTGERLGAGAVVTLVIAVLMVGAAAGIEFLLPASPGGEEMIVGQGPVAAGSWYCPVTGGGDETAMLTVAAIGRDPSTVVVSHFHEGRPVDDPPVTVAVGDALEVRLEPEQAAEPIAVRWQGGPAIAHWRVDGAADFADAPCEAGPSATWHLTGFDTTVGSKALLHLFNPFGEDAVARLRFSTPAGPVDLVIADNQLVPAGTSVAVDLADFQPEQSDLGVIVDVLSGRLIAQGQMQIDGGLGGRALVRGASQPAMQWDAAHLRSDDASAAWLSVQNPSDREAAVEIQVSSPNTEGDALLGEMSVPAGGILRVELDGVSTAPEFGVAVRGVNDTPVVVTAFWTFRTDQGRSLSGSLAAPGPATEWALAGGGTAERSGEVSVYNPGAEDATVTLLAPAGRLPEWSGLTVRPNERITVDLAVAGVDVPEIPVRVVSDRPVVVELRSLSADGPPRLWASVGVPAVEWAGPPTRPRVAQDPWLETTPILPFEPEAADELDPADLELLPPQAPAGEAPADAAPGGGGGSDPAAPDAPAPDGAAAPGDPAAPAAPDGDFVDNLPDLDSP